MWRKPTAVDLFSGCGGLTLGLKRAGYRVLAAVEIDALSVETYSSNHPEVRLYEADIRQVSPRAFLKAMGLKAGELDLLAGCPPCQGFSNLRTLNRGRRVIDARNDLIYDFLSFVEVLRPCNVMLENVPGLVKDRRFADFRRTLTAMGYNSAVDVLNAADYGVPQRRQRLILMASLSSLPEFGRPARKQRSVRDAIGSLPPPSLSQDPLHAHPERRGAKVRAMIERIPRDGGSRIDAGEQFQLACHRKCDGFFDIYGRMSWDDVAPTITSGCHNPSKGRFLHPEQDRAITLREAALLQSFPSRYKFSLRRGKEAAAAMIGNALPPEFVRRHAKRLREQSERST